MKDNFLKLGILGGRDVPFDTSLSLKFVKKFEKFKGYKF
jgi:hypothetical protein